jgi:Ni/Co efflux regulator RcnB
VKPPVVKPPYYRPPVWHKPTASRWWWRNRWTDRLRGPVFVYPRGYGYRHWVAGDRLPMLFLTAPHFYDDFATLGLDPPLPGYRWVRYGPDLLLVNLNTGEVEEVAYGVFY